MRNIKLFQNLILPDREIKNFILYKAAEYWTSIPSYTNPNNAPTNSQLSVLAWMKLAQGWSKLNTDGSSKRNIIADEGVIKTYQGQWTIGFTKFIGIGSCLMAEAWALFTGLQIANSIKLSKIEIKLNNQELFTLINNAKINNNPFSHLFLIAGTSSPVLRKSSSPKLREPKTSLLMQWLR